MGVNYKWRLAYSIAHIGFSKEDLARDNFPASIDCRRIARMQHPTPFQIRRTLYNQLIDDCKRGDLQHTETTARVMTVPARNVDPPAIDVGGFPSQFIREGVRYGYTQPGQYKDLTSYTVTAQAFAAWMAAQRQTPSEHIAAWFEAMGVNTQPSAATVTTQTLTPEQTNDRKETKEQRQTRRYQQGVDAGLAMPTNDYARMPRGIGALAQKEGIKRQSYVEDVKAHINRTFAH